MTHEEKRNAIVKYLVGCGAVESKGYSEILFLDANDPFYNSAWGMIPDSCLAKCCEAVKARAARGM